jgi:hypothetical protein
MPVLLGIPCYRRIPFEGTRYGVEGDGYAVLLKASHDPPDSCSGSIVELRLGGRVTYAQFGGELRQVNNSSDSGSSKTHDLTKFVQYGLCMLIAILAAPLSSFLVV